jgi:hypothetical protein
MGCTLEFGVVRHCEQHGTIYVYFEGGTTLDRCFLSYYKPRMSLLPPVHWSIEEGRENINISAFSIFKSRRRFMLLRFSA